MKLTIIVGLTALLLSSCKPDPERIAEKAIGDYTDVSALVYDLCKSNNISRDYRASLIALNDWFYVNRQYLKNTKMDMSLEELLECFELSYCTDNYISVDWDSYMTHEKMSRKDAQTCKIDQNTMIEAVNFGWEYQRGVESNEYMSDYQNFIFSINEIYKEYEGEWPDYYWIKNIFCSYIEKYEEWVFECMDLYDDLPDTIYQLWIDNEKYYSIEDDIKACLQRHIDNMYDLHLIEEYNNCVEAFNARNKREAEEIERQMNAAESLLMMGLLGL